ncbi:unnamed protein product [Microthlaspi erraticum]|uniref:Disease resistance R13L4/SHOC-2-like LRR domain-containing protein n=1 Tax=Microthlaspi erraticum TaxID=1685480 RepID=A0A6D2I2U0_9BRAS|nr:unnamed protein product [Microthlaspi erraticum]
MTTMLKSCMRLHFLLLLLFCCVSPSSFAFRFKNPVVGLVACRPHQIQALTQFKNEFDTRRCNPNDYFNGVLCDNSTGEVTMLRLRACLSGTLMPNSSLFKFHHLRHLNLSGNNFISSSLPSEFGNLNRLEILSLFSSGFLGQVPLSFGNLSQLTYLELYDNKLTGSFPLLRNLSMLKVLDLSGNHFSGSLDPKSSLFELHQLHYLNLDFNNFKSSLPSNFGSLNQLEVLHLQSNGFFGQVPPTISNLTGLTELFLSNNRLTGSFPLVQNLTKLSHIDLLNNYFTGIIPPSIFTMPFLSYLNLQRNDLNGSIEVPNSSTLSRLQTLYLGHNHLEGNMLEPILKLTSLTQLDLSFLNTSYPIDLNFFSSLKSLFSLNLSGNKISTASLSSDSYIPLQLLFLKQCGIKEFPNILKSLQNLYAIDMSINEITGKIPEWLWSLPRLNSVVVSYNLFDGFKGSTKKLVNSSVQILVLDKNYFQGALPHLPLSIKDFSASHNRFSGDIPLSICDRSLLFNLELSYNNFTGPIPQCLSNLTYLKLRKNNLQGSILDTFDVDATLQTLDVGFNRLTGNLPRSLLNCSSLKILSVDSNRIKDTFPFWLKALPNLQILTLSSNELYGPISLSHQGSLGFPELRIFEISNNKFSGSLSPDYFVNWKASSRTMNEDECLYMVYNIKALYGGDLSFTITETGGLHYKGLHMEQAQVLTSYATIDFSGNKLEGQIPESLGLLKALIALNLSNNAFTGHIPLSFSNLGKLESLDLSSNHLSGTIPNGLGSLSFLEYINVSHNQLQGEIPQGTQITGQPISSFEGNSRLCGLPLHESCFGNHVPSTQPPNENEEDEEKEQVLSWKAVAIGYGVGVFLGLAIAQVIASYKPEWLTKIIGTNKRRNH